MDIQGYGISITTLEEVFLKINKEFEQMKTIDNVESGEMDLLEQPVRDKHKINISEEISNTPNCVEGEAETLD